MTVAALLWATMPIFGPTPVRCDVWCRPSGEVRVRVLNAGAQPLLLARYDFAWEVRLFRGRKQFSEQQAFLEGSTRGGSVYYPPQLRVPRDVDWVLLQPGDETRFDLRAVSFDGRSISVRAGDEVELRYDPESVGMPEWPRWVRPSDADKLVGPVVSRRARIRPEGRLAPE